MNVDTTKSQTSQTQSPLPPQYLSLDSKVIGKFLKLFTPDNVSRGLYPFHWQFFPDQKDSTALPFHRYLTYSNVEPFLNQAEIQGMGIFITINETDGSGRSKKNIVKLRACFIDQDDAPTLTKKQIKELPLEPSAIVERSHNRWHAYWKISNSHDTKKTLPDSRKKTYEYAQRILATYFGSDTQVADVARVMRVPGTLHQKDTNNKVVPKITYYKPENSYTLERIINAFKKELTEEQNQLLEHTFNQSLATRLIAETQNLKDGSPDTSKQTINKAKQEIESLSPGIMGVNGSKQLFKAFAVCYENGLSPKDALRVVTTSDWLTKKCEPVWQPTNSAEDAIIIRKTLNDVYVRNYASNRFGTFSPKAVFKDIEENESLKTLSTSNHTSYSKSPNSTNNINDNLSAYERQIETIRELQLEVTSNGKISKKIHNLMRIFHESLSLDNLFFYNQFSKRIEIAEGKSIPFSNTIQVVKDSVTGEIFRRTVKEVAGKKRVYQDTDALALRTYISKMLDIDAGTKLIQDLITLEADKNSRNPLQEKVTSVEWDRVRRIDKLFIEYAEPKLSSNIKKQQQEISYYKRVSEIFIKSMMARLFFPGCKCDYTPVIEGQQGINKSTALKTLALGYSGEVTLNLNEGKDLIMKCHTNWLNEIAENNVDYRSADALKAFLTTEEDNIRLPYGTVAMSFPRAFVFGITLNPNNRYFKDPTGNRRFLPVKVNRWDIEKLERDVMQIHAEAYHKVVTLKEKWYVEDRDDEFYKIANEEQEQRREVDSWFNQIKKYVDNLEQDASSSLDKISIEQVWKNCLKGDMKYLTYGSQRRIESILRMEVGLEELEDHSNGLFFKLRKDNSNDNINNINNNNLIEELF